MATSRRREGWAQPQDWEPVRTAIERLYLEEKKTLKEVVSAMEKEHRFYAT